MLNVKLLFYFSLIIGIYISLIRAREVEFKGLWDASTNNPNITPGVGLDGHFYIVETEGNVGIDGITEWKKGDIIIFYSGIDRWIRFESKDLEEYANKRDHYQKKVPSEDIGISGAIVTVSAILVIGCIVIAVIVKSTSSSPNNEKEKKKKVK